MPGELRSPGMVNGNATPARVLVVDDEVAIADLVRSALAYEGYEVVQAHNAADALARAEQFRPHLMILDIMLPDADGFEVVRRLRQTARSIPVVFLTARDSTDDKVRGLTLGADDYLTKPFSLEELLARVRAVLRRSGFEVDNDHVLRFGDLELDEDSHEVWRSGSAIELTATEFKLLRYLMLNARRVVSKAQILDHVWEYDFGGDANIVETYISYLRRKIDADDRPPLIRTLRGSGYSLRMPDTSSRS